MNELFANCVSLKLLLDISNWDTCNVINMEKMFYNCRSLSLLPDISNWNTNNVINMEKMFYNCLTLTSIPDKFRMDNDINLSDLINNNCISMVFFPEKSKRKIKNTIPSSMIGRYYSMYKLIYEIKKENIINLFDSQFINKNRRNCEIIINNKIHPLLDKYEISDYSQKYLKIKLLILNNKRIDLSYMFNDCESLKKFYLFSQKKNNFKNEEENLMKEEYNDEKAESIITNKENLQINPFYNYDKSNNTFKEISNDKKLIHNNYRNQIHFIYSNKNINSDIEKEKIKEIMKNSGKYLSEISSFDSYEPQNNNINEINSTTETEYPTIKTKINKSNKNNENQTINEILYYFKLNFSNSSKKNNIIPTDLSSMFCGCSSLISVSGISHWDMSIVTSMEHMFDYCTLLKKIDDISNWKFNFLFDINYMFYSCSSLLFLPDISKWNTNCLENMSNLFLECSSLKSLPDISKWNTNNVKDLSKIFCGCSSLKSLPDISK